MTPLMFQVFDYCYNLLLQYLIWHVPHWWSESGSSSITIWGINRFRRHERPLTSATTWKGILDSFNFNKLHISKPLRLTWISTGRFLGTPISCSTLDCNSQRASTSSSSSSSLFFMSSRFLDWGSSSASAVSSSSEILTSSENGSSSPAALSCFDDWYFGCSMSAVVVEVHGS